MHPGHIHTIARSLMRLTDKAKPQSNKYLMYALRRQQYLHLIPKSPINSTQLTDVFYLLCSVSPSSQCRDISIH